MDDVTTSTTSTTTTADHGGSLEVMNQSTIRDNNYAEDMVRSSNGSVSGEAVPAPVLPLPPPRPSINVAPTSQRYYQILPSPRNAHRRPHPSMNRIFVRGGPTDQNPAHLGRPPHVQFHNHVQLDLGRSHGVVTVPLHRQLSHSNDGITTSMGGSRGGVNVRVVQVDPLIPQPAPDSTIGPNTTNNKNNNSTAFASRRSKKQNGEKTESSFVLDRFKCDICYDYLKDPVGCGKCSSRFCLVCLDRVYQSDLKRLNMMQPHNENSPSDVNDSSSNSNSNIKIHPKCPTCRQEYEHIVPDHTLNHELHHGPTLSCRYDGCPEESLRLPEVADHEKVCVYAPVRCRYASYGCRWTGKRRMVHSHEQYGCKVAPIGLVIDELRSMKADHGTRIGMVGQQVGESFRMSNYVRQNMAKNNMLSISDIFSVLHYCMMMTCAGPLFLFTKDKWALYWRPKESRAAVINVLIFAPFMLTSFGTFLNGTNSFLNLLDILTFVSKSSQSATSTGEGNGTGGAPTIWTASSQRHIEDAFLGLCAGLLGILVVTVNFVDTKSSISWRGMPIPHLGNPPVVCDLIAISTFTLILTVMEYHNSGFKALALWTVIALCSTFFPSMILSVSTYALHGVMDQEPHATAAKMSGMARSVEPLMFGLRFGLLATYFGMLPCLDAIILVGVLPRSMLGRLRDKLILKDCFMEKLPFHTYGLAVLGLKVGIWAFQQRSLFSGLDISTLLNHTVGWGDDGGNKNRWQLGVTLDLQQQQQQLNPLRVLEGMIGESILATIALLLMNCFISCSTYLGIRAGNTIASTSQMDVVPDAGIHKDYNFVGIVTFAGWAMTMIVILQL